MRKILICYFSLFIISGSIYGQDDYVIDQPIEHAKNKVFSEIPNPDFTSYMLFPTSYTLKKRDIRLSNTDVLYFKGSYGLTNNTTASLSISLVGTLTGSIKHQFTINDEVKLGVSGSVGQLFFIPKDPLDTFSTVDTSVVFGGGQAMITLGDIQDNITFGVGFYYANSTVDMINEEKEFFLSNMYVGIQKQLGRRVYLIGEGIYFWNYNVISGSLGIKITIKQSMSLGFGVMPLAWIDPTINSTHVESTAIPLITFRMLLDRH